MRRTLPQHGYTLVVVIVLLTVLMVLGAGAIRMAGAGTRGAIAQRSSTTVAACARAARDVIKSQIRFMNPLPEEFSLQLVADGEVVQTIEDGHREDLPSLTDIASVEFITDSALGTGRSPSLHPRISNDIMPASEFTGSAMRVVAVCTDADDRTHEVEFLLRYGL